MLKTYKDTTYKIIIIFSFFINAETSAAYTSRQKNAIRDLKRIEEVLKAYHPGNFDQESNGFRSWLTQGKKEFYERLPKIDCYAAVLFSLHAYVAGFHDAHVVLSGWGERWLKDIKEWPLFLAQFNGKRFIATESKTALVPNGSSIIKIDGIDTKEWIDRNIIPYTSVNPKESAAYYHTAPGALIWKHNPFIIKPKTICIQSKHVILNQETKIKLTWHPLSHANTLKKCSKIFKTPSWRERTLDPITIKDIAHDVTWIKIPTFMPKTTGLHSKMFERSIKKLSTKRSKRALVFDLRGNDGGYLSLAGKTLQYLYGGAETTRALEACRTGAGYFPTIHTSQRFEGMGESFTDKITDAFISESNEIIEEPYLPIEKACPLTEPSPKEPVASKMYVIIDSAVFSTSLLFIDILKKLTNDNVILIGQPTNADTSYTGIEGFRLEGGGYLSMPIFIHRGRPRKSNEPYLPDFPLSGTRMKDDAWLKQKVLDIIEGRIQKPKASV